MGMHIADQKIPCNIAMQGRELEVFWLIFLLVLKSSYLSKLHNSIEVLIDATLRVSPSRAYRLDVGIIGRRSSLVFRAAD